MSPLKSARQIWREQNDLNAKSHPRKTGTIEIGENSEIHRFGTLSPEKAKEATDLQAEVSFDYYLALHDEVAELINNFIWKHWAKEAKEGRRYQLIHPEAKSGEGSAQNVGVELTDIIFFVVSLMQTDGERAQTWESTWGREDHWMKAATDLPQVTGPRLLDLNNNRLLLLDLKKLEESATLREWSETVLALIRLCCLAGLTWMDMDTLYHQKLQINLERLERGRRQVGDTLADAESARLSTAKA